jgi:K+-sensing histidine kinase KdpD
MADLQIKKAGEEMPGDIAGLQVELKKARARVRQLKLEIESRQEETDRVLSDNLQQNEELSSLNAELMNFNQELEKKVHERTLALEAAKQDLEEHARKLEELSVTKDALMHMIVHDMKNPLTVILGTMALFKTNRYNLEEDLYASLVDSRLQAMKLLRMIEEILFISRMKTKEFQLKPSEFEINEVVKKCVETMVKTQGNKKLALNAVLSANPCRVKADLEIIERVINNLINNSIKYAPTESEIRIEVVPDESRVNVNVTNWGDPIPAEFHQKIFEMFSRVNTKDKQLSGTGLGLAFCKMAMEAHAGSIWVTSPVSSENRGACFSFQLPLIIG